MSHGSITLNGVTDPDLIALLNIKEKFPKEVGFTPNAIQTANNTNPQIYNNVTFTWTGAGLEGVIDALKHIHERERPKPAG